MRRFLIIPCLFVLALLVPSPAVHADEGWIINRADTEIAIQRDGILRIVETLEVDFGDLQKHGIFRAIPVVFDYDGTHNRVYDLHVLAVTDANGTPRPYEEELSDAYHRLKIGDPDATISGSQTYQITYTVEHALNGFADHDELFWNATSTWPVRTERATARVTLPGVNALQVACYQGPRRSREACNAIPAGETVGFETTRPLPEDEQFTVVVSLPKGVVPTPQPKLESKPRALSDFFTLTPVNVGGSAALLAVIVGLLGLNWWQHGRDRRFTTIHYLTDNPTQETRPLFAGDAVVVEYQPPEQSRPAQLGLLLTEHADTLGITATIVDLAVRGYLRITEVQSGGILGRFKTKDWEFTRLKDAGELEALLPYERIVFNGLFGGRPDVGQAMMLGEVLRALQGQSREGRAAQYAAALQAAQECARDQSADTVFSGATTVLLSALKYAFYPHLALAQSSLYQDAANRKWFDGRPDLARRLWKGLGIGVVVVGVGAGIGLGYLFGAGLFGGPIIVGGLLLTALAGHMPRRTAKGSELLRRTLGFRQYIVTAETDRQRFNEQQNLFAEYLPYAIIFRCVDKWARAFRDIDIQAQIAGWYEGNSGFEATSFSRELTSFSSVMDSTITSAPSTSSTSSSSGESGFSSGSGSGGGGGGGHGGSW